MTEITDKLIAVEVPENAYDFDFDKAIYTNLYDLTNGESLDVLSHKEEDFKVIGVITKQGQFDFDCGMYVEPINDKKFIKYTDYTRRCKTKEASFISLLNSKGIHLDKLEGKLLILEKI